MLASLFYAFLATTTLQTQPMPSQSVFHIIEEAKAQEIALPPILKKIAWCESRGVLTAKNKYSTASGKYQWLWDTWYHYGRELWGDDFYNKSIWSEKDNDELALYVYNKYGTKDWEVDPKSKACWSPVDDD